MQRHSLLFFNQEGQELLHKELFLAHPFLKKVFPTSSLATIPAILRQQTMAKPGYINVGFSLPLRQDGVRIRLSSTLPLACLQHTLTPFEVTTMAIQKQGATAPLLQALVEKGQHAGLRVGLYGSCALQVVTKFPYLHRHSDVDIFLAATCPTPCLPFFAQTLAQLATEKKWPIDCEILCNEHYGVKLAEILSRQKTVLGKGPHGIRLLPRQALSFFPNTQHGPP